MAELDAHGALRALQDFLEKHMGREGLQEFLLSRMQDKVPEEWLHRENGHLQLTIEAFRDPAALPFPMSEEERLARLYAVLIEDANDQVGKYFSPVEETQFYDECPTGDVHFPMNALEFDTRVPIFDVRNEHGMRDVRQVLEFAFRVDEAQEWRRFRLPAGVVREDFHKTAIMSKCTLQVDSNTSMSDVFLSVDAGISQSVFDEGSAVSCAKAGVPPPDPRHLGRASSSSSASAGQSGDGAQLFAKTMWKHDVDGHEGRRIHAAVPWTTGSYEITVKDTFLRSTRSTYSPLDILFARMTEKNIRTLDGEGFKVEGTNQWAIQALDPFVEAVCMLRRDLFPWNDCFTSLLGLQQFRRSDGTLCIPMEVVPRIKDAMWDIIRRRNVVDVTQLAFDVCVANNVETEDVAKAPDFRHLVTEPTKPEKGGLVRGRVVLWYRALDTPISGASGFDLTEHMAKHALDGRGAT